MTKTRSAAPFVGALITAVLLSTSAYAGDQVVQTTSNVYNWWDLEHPVGTATLVRNDTGLTAIVNTSNLPPRQAVTLWFIFLNKPENCSTNPCTLPDDVFAPTTEGDFHFASGHVTGESGTTSFAARLNVGDTSGSGRAEIGFDDGLPLTNPFGAEVVLALHVHGPAAHEGALLRSQISSYTGGCDVFLGPNGFASGPGDVPDQLGECSTTQRSLHQSPFAEAEASSE